jgi:hypothetical protein
MFVAFAVEQSHSGDISAFTFGQLRSLFDLREHLARGGDVLFRPERVIVGHRFAPVSHREIWVHFGRLAKRLDRLFVPERVQSSQSAYEVLLRFRRTRSRKLNASELRLLRAHMQRHQPKYCHDN